MTVSYIDFLRRIGIRCSDFLIEGIPLYRSLPSSMGEFRRVKVRFKRRLQSSPLNEALGEQVSDRCVLVSTQRPVMLTEAEASHYYVFPVNGYRVSWSPLQIALDDAPVAVRHGNLALASRAGRDAIVYDIPDYYVVSVAACLDYSTLVEAITSSTFEPMK